jgi:hypothetical protein
MTVLRTKTKWRTKMGKPGLWHNIGVENFELLKLLEKHRDLTYDQYFEFCIEKNEFEICGCADHNPLGADFLEVCHERGYRTKNKYLYDEIARAKRTIKAKNK